MQNLYYNCCRYKAESAGRKHILLCEFRYRNLNLNMYFMAVEKGEYREFL